MHPCTARRPRPAMLIQKQTQDTLLRPPLTPLRQLETTAQHHHPRVIMPPRLATVPRQSQQATSAIRQVTEPRHLLLTAAPTPHLLLRATVEQQPMVRPQVTVPRRLPLTVATMPQLWLLPTQELLLTGHLRATVPRRPQLKQAMIRHLVLLATRGLLLMVHLQVTVPRLLRLTAATMPHLPLLGTAKIPPTVHLQVTPRLRRLNRLPTLRLL